MKSKTHPKILCGVERHPDGYKETFTYKICAKFTKLCRRLGIKLYSSKYSKKDFTLHQWITLLALKQYKRGSIGRR